MFLFLWSLSPQTMATGSSGFAASRLSARGAMGAAAVESGSTRVSASAFLVPAGPAASEQNTVRVRCEAAGWHDSDFSAQCTRDFAPAIAQAVAGCVFADQVPSGLCVSLNVLIIRDGGSALAAAISAAGMALADAGIPCRDTLVASAVAIEENSGTRLKKGAVRSGNKVLVHRPTATDERAAQAVVTVAVLSATGQLPLVWHAGVVSSAVLSDAVLLAVSGAQQLREVVAAALLPPAADTDADV